MESSVTFLLASYYKDISLVFKGKTYIIRQKTRNYAVQYNLQLCKKIQLCFPNWKIDKLRENHIFPPTCSQLLCVPG